MSSTTDDPTAAGAAAAAQRLDLVDERLIAEEGLGGYLRAVGNRLRSGELGNLPVVLGLVVIAAVFYALEPVFLSSRNLEGIMQFAAPVGVISLGIVLVLLLGEIDLSVGAVSGFTSAVMAVLVVQQGQSMLVGVLAAIGVGVLIGLLYAALYTRLGVPSFVFSLAGLLAFQGMLLLTLGDTGTINLPRDSGLVEFARFRFLEGAAAYVLVALVALGYLASQLLTIRTRAAAGLSTPWMPLVLVRTALLGGGLAALTAYLGVSRGWPYLFLFFVALVVVLDVALRRTRWGRHLLAVGGNEEASRRSGIRVGLVYTSAFVGASALAAVGGLLAAAQVTSVSQGSGLGDTNLTAIAAAVIGGTSLFGGRGSAYSALLGILVLTAIQNGLNLLGVDSAVRFVVTGGVLLLAVAIDSVSRRARAASGRG